MKKLFFAVCLFFCLIWCVSAQDTNKQSNDRQMEGFEFIERDIDEILFSISLYSGISITADDTVHGKATFRFAGKSFESAFDSFLKAERLFVSKKDDLWTVSRIRIEDSENGVELEALDVDVFRIIEALSSRYCICISGENLPSGKMSFHLYGKTVEDLLKSFTLGLGKNFELTLNEGNYLISRKSEERFDNSRTYSVKHFTVEEKQSEDELTYSVEANKCSSKEVLEELFRVTGKQYVMEQNSFSELGNVKFSGQNFVQTLNLLCDVSNLVWFVDNNVYFIFAGSGRENYKSHGYEWKKYELNYITVSEFNSICYSIKDRNDWKSVPLTGSGDKGFLAFASKQQHEEIKNIISLCDTGRDYETVELKFITVAELLRYLPFEIKASQFVSTSQDNVAFFAGSKEEVLLLNELIGEIDVPVKRLCYDLLVMQYQYTGEETWENTLNGKPAVLGDRTSVAGSLGSVLSLNLDVLSTFGYSFAVCLQSALNENKAHVYADTKVYGISGGDISFKNTSTYRYRDNNLDPETGEPVYTGVTREIVSGLTIDVKGWISGDGMITSSITASVSRQGTDLSSKTGNPPPTSEKVIKTEVRGKSGEGIILSGLIQNEKSESNQGLPLISKIPLIGKFWGSTSKNIERTELVIYLVPHWITDEKDCGEETDEEFACRVLMDLVFPEN